VNMSMILCFIDR